MAGQICFIPAGWSTSFACCAAPGSPLCADVGPHRLRPSAGQHAAGGPSPARPSWPRGGEGAYLTVLGQELPSAPGAGPAPAAGAGQVCRAIHLTLTALAADCGASVRHPQPALPPAAGCSFRQWREQVVLGRARQLQHRGSRWPRSPIGSATRIPAPCPAPPAPARREPAA